MDHIPEGSDQSPSSGHDPKKGAEEVKESPMNIFGLDIDLELQKTLNTVHHTTYTVMPESFPSLPTMYRIIRTHLSILRFAPQANPLFAAPPLSVVSPLDESRKKFIASLRSIRESEEREVLRYIANSSNLAKLWEDPCFRLGVSKGPTITTGEAPAPVEKCDFVGEMPLVLQLVRKVLVNFKRNVKSRRNNYVSTLQKSQESMQAAKTGLTYNIAADSFYTFYQDFNGYLQCCLSVNELFGTVNDVLNYVAGKLGGRNRPHFVLEWLIKMYRDIAVRMTAASASKVFFAAFKNLLVLVHGNGINRRNVTKLLYETDIQKLKVAADHLSDLIELDPEANAFSLLLSSPPHCTQSFLTILQPDWENCLNQALDVIEEDPKLSAQSLAETTQVFAICIKHFLSPAAARGMSQTLYSRAFRMMQRRIAGKLGKGAYFIPPPADQEDEPMEDRKEGGNTWICIKPCKEFMQETLGMSEAEIKQSLGKAEEEMKNYEALLNAYTDWKATVETNDERVNEYMRSMKITMS